MTESIRKQGIPDWRRKYLTIWFGQGISSLTTSIVQIALIWYITDTTKSAAILSAATLIGFVPQAVLGLFIGVLIDRYDRKKIMIISDIVMSLACLVLVFAAAAGNIPVWLILVVLCVRSIGSAFFEPSLQAVMPLIIPEDQLTKYAGYSQSFSSAAMVISPALAGMLYSLVRLEYILMLDALGAAVSISTLLITAIPPLIRRTADEIENENPGILREARDGYLEIKRVDGMRELLIIGALYAIIYFPIGTLYPFISLTYFKSGVEGSGLVESLFSAGSLIGSLLLGVVGGRIDKIRSLAGSMAIYGAGCTLTGLLSPDLFHIFVVLSFLMGVSVPFYFGIETAIFQIHIGGEYLGRVLSLSSSISMIAMPLGMLLSGALVDKIGINIWFLGCGIFTLCISVLPLVIPSVRKCA